ncbi:LSM domain-containing protein [Diplogelasinospora grovesii]|uniref:LSM domain-containing protein n=1 Tax=Diplogelasinospora grovesii TaxID=303347 RepID=A0AAN6S430_9PEZI|nr:LSM domain-containing protein [Diplogelasinospora grovesii]
MPAAEQMSRGEAGDFLQSLLNKNLRVTTTDARMFWGGFKCTDPESNVILQHTYEYRHPSTQQLLLAEAVATTGNNNNGTIKMEMQSRYLGLVVIPGKYITKIEVEEFASQLPK